MTEEESAKAQEAPAAERTPAAAPEDSAQPKASPADAAASVAEPQEAPVLGEPTRQWVSLPGSSCNVRIGHGNLERLGKDLKSSVGKPQKAALLAADDADPGLLQKIFYQLTDAGFRAAKGSLPSGASALAFGSANGVFAELDRLEITSDDVAVVVGGAEQLSLASYALGAWCQGTPVCAVPLDMEALICATVTPQGLSVGAHRDMVRGKSSLKNVFADFGLIDLSDTEKRRRAFAVMVATAVSDTEKAFEALFDRREALAAGDEVALREQCNESLRSRGRIVSSTSVAVRQSLEYGAPFAQALRALVPAGVPESVLLAEGLRFMARVAVTEEEFKVDDMLSQDELLESLGLGTLSCTLSPEEILKAMRRAAFLHSNRFMLALPRSFGRVRLATVEDATLLAHLDAWCSQHAARS